MILKDALHIVSQFSINEAVIDVFPLGDGFINDTYFVKTDSKVARHYILQRKNKHVFTDIPQMMNNQMKVITHLKSKISEAGGNPEQETLTVILTHDQTPYFLADDGEYWVLTLFIDNTQTFHQVDSPQLAFQAGAAIATFHRYLSDFKDSLYDVLPGFHNIRFRLQQWQQALLTDAFHRARIVAPEIAFVERYADRMLGFYELYETGVIPCRVAHNDTKISNFLFDKNHRVQTIIDLDTVANSTCLNDIGDAIRSYTNTAAEDEADLRKVSMNVTILNAYKEGYLAAAGNFLTDIEKQYFDFSGSYITYEQVVRFLMDYLEGDHYYKIKYPEHNLIRTRSQIKLFESFNE